MIKLMQNQYRRIVMKSGNPTWLDRRILALANYTLFPEFRTRSYGGHLKWCIRGLLAYFALSMLMDFNYVHEKLNERNNELASVYNNIELIKEDVYVRALDSLRASEDYIRCQIYKETGIAVPKKVSGEHLQTIVQQADKVPLKIYLRVIYHESRFDSTAVNATSGAFGYCQMMPRTFGHIYEALQLEGGRTAVNNLKVGAELLAKEFRYWTTKRETPNEAWEMALACYAMGDSLPRAINSVPGAARQYVDYVLHKKEL